MKRLGQPTTAQPHSELPLEPVSVRTLNLGADESDDSANKPSDPIERTSELPKANVLYNRMKKLNSFKKIKHNYKLQSQKDQFVADLKELFCHLDATQNKYNTELLIELLNAVEEYVIFGNKEEREKQKHDIVMELMIPFFDNEEILKSFVLSVSAKIKKSNIFRRLFKRLYRFFF